MSNDLEKLEHTNRGFGYRTFKDTKGVECSIQHSSSAMEECIWLGSNTLGVKVLIEGVGWIDRPEFDGDKCVGNNRMHLNRSQVAELIPILQRFVDSGDI